MIVRDEIRISIAGGTNIGKTAAAVIIKKAFEEHGLDFKVLNADGDFEPKYKHVQDNDSVAEFVEAIKNRGARLVIEDNNRFIKEVDVASRPTTGILSVVSET